VRGACNVGRVTPAGVIAEFPLPTPAGQPSVITQGPDGALWWPPVEAVGEPRQASDAATLIQASWALVVPYSDRRPSSHQRVHIRNGHQELHGTGLEGIRHGELVEVSRPIVVD
jgi:hypothetical protein